jgi:hypothetical protein
VTISPKITSSSMHVGDKEKADPEGIEACQRQAILKKSSDLNAVYSVNFTREVIQ